MFYLNSNYYFYSHRDIAIELHPPPICLNSISDGGLESLWVEYDFEQAACLEQLNRCLEFSIYNRIGLYSYWEYLSEEGREEHKAERERKKQANKKQTNKQKQGLVSKSSFNFDKM